MNGLTHRLATEDDLPALHALMDAAVAGPLSAFLSPEQVQASRTIMGMDSQLIADRTYFLIEAGGVAAGCGGWSRRITIYGGDHTPGRRPALLTPGIDSARVRAMYTHPAFVRRGIGRMILDLCEAAARAEGYDRVELVATFGGRAALSVSGLCRDRAVRGRSGRGCRAARSHGQAIALTRLAIRASLL